MIDQTELRRKMLIKQLNERQKAIVPNGTPARMRLNGTGNYFVIGDNGTIVYGDNIDAVLRLAAKRGLTPSAE